MKVSELEPGKKFTLEAVDEDRNMQLKGTIANVTAERDLTLLKQLKQALQNTFYCFADPIRDDNRLLNFESEKVTCNMVTILEGEKPYVWNNVKIMNVKLPVYGSIHIIVSKNDGAFYNRRQNYRVFLGIEGTIDAEDGSEPKRATVKDLCANGIGLITQQKENFERGDLMTVVFNEAESGTEFHLKAAVVRNDEMDDGRYNIGCILRSNADVVARFVYDKQKKKMKGAPAAGSAPAAESGGDGTAES